MPVPKYYCDYCDKQFQDTPGERKRHERGIQHQQAKARWYDSFKLEEKVQQQHHSNARSSQGSPKPLCYHFVNSGFCHFGESCIYFHPSANNVPQPSMISAPNMPQPSMMSTLNNMAQPSMLSAPFNMPQPSMMSASFNMPQLSMMSVSNNILQSSMINTPTTKETLVQDRMGMSWENLPPSLHPPPEGGYPSLSFVDWG